ncbi:Lrp/AsnC family transcriptional regulator [Paraburkholderia caribensis]|uniref:Lrp/AsnC family transcriptional regulator n=1 Tax=Paraburkholderia caribensis TaxID=75105 RepID=UPI00077215C0|nr:Lrp/AsnC family transcriptional regulator [Paraburkholderia caribensis]|eukprot:XP_015584190.1 uncharacterized protein LOC107262556 [Ricinus communis]
MGYRKIDSTDARILDYLQRDSGLTNVELAGRVGLSPSPCLTRVKALERDGVISRYVAVLDPAALGLHVDVFIRVRLKEQARETMAAFEDAMKLRDEVIDCYLMSGEADYLLRVMVPDVRSLERFTVEHLARLSGVASIQSSLSLKEVKSRAPIPVP